MLKKRSKKNKSNNSPLSLDKDYIIECRFCEEKTYRISLNLVEKIWKEAKDNKKLPKLILGIRRNDKEVFILNCFIGLENNKNKIVG